MVLIDLHVHTDRSDGSTPPADVVAQASNLGLEALAIADHDTLAGYDAALYSAEASQLELVCAVELSTRPISEARNRGKRPPSVHLLGYFVLSPPSSSFRLWLETQQQSRRERNQLLIANLHRLGVNISLADAEVYGRNQVGRPHFAKVLLDKGYVSTLQEAFDRYLADDAQAAAQRDEPSLEEGIRRIREGGGFAALAHPVRLNEKDEELARLIARLREEGLEGLEVYHSEHTPSDSASYLALAERFDLIPTGGSDYHGHNKPGVQMGTGIGDNVNLPYSFLEQIRDMCCARRQ